MPVPVEKEGRPDQAIVSVLLANGKQFSSFLLARHSHLNPKSVSSLQQSHLLSYDNLDRSLSR
jgi:hypothetical protein